MQLEVLTRWLGYLEHATPRLLGIPDANVGKGGCTVFAQMVWDSQRINLMNLPWCCTFVHAVINRPDLLGKANSGCRTLQRRMKKIGMWRERDYTPCPGDVVFCSNRRTSRVDHVGIVECVDGDTVVSIDGNTVDPSGTFDPSQGGAVARRIRKLTDPVIVGYGPIGELY